MFATATGLWLAVVASGLYHGINPGMGWPLAVSAALFERKGGALARALAALGVGHFLSMLAVLLPFAALAVLAAYETEIRLGAGALVIGFGLFLLIRRRHPAALARIPPTRLALWSFLVALAHGAGLMLVPIYLGLCSVAELDAGHRAAGTLVANNAGLLLAVAFVHTAAMLTAGGIASWIVYRFVGLKALSATWFNLDVAWALSLVAVGVIGIWTAL